MPYWRAFYHLVWTTKHRAPELYGSREAAFVRSVRAVCGEEGWMLHAFGVMPDHVHLALSVPPSDSIANVVRKLKIHSNHRISAAIDPRTDGEFAWQTEYGMFTFSDNLFQPIIQYILNQKAHHAQNSLWPELEQLAPRTGKFPKSIESN
jgi:putative transposase